MTVNKIKAIWDDLVRVAMACMLGILRRIEVD